jgi:hypothetical protein
VSRKISIVPFEPWHAAKIRLRDFDARCFAGIGHSPAAMGRFWEAYGPGFTGLLPDGEVAACGGVAIQWPGFGVGWAITSDLVDDYMLTFHKTFKRMIAHIERSRGLVRIQTTVHADHLVSRRWLKRLGFETEGLMRRYIGGDDYYLMARVRHGS